MMGGAGRRLWWPAGRAATILVWGVMMAWLVRYEAFPQFFLHTLPGYRALFSEGALVCDNWMKITFEGHHIGYTHTLVDVKDSDPTEEYIIRNETRLILNVMGEEQDIRMAMKAGLDALYALESFTFEMNAGGYSMRMSGRRQEGTRFAVAMNSPAGLQKFSVEIPEDAVLYASFNEGSFMNLKPGSHVSLRTFDPTTMSVAKLTVRALRREVIRHGGREVNALVLATEFEGMEVLSWLAEDGRLLRQETPFGWTLEECPPAEAVAIEKGGGEDILGAMAMPCRGEIVRPRACRLLEVRLEGLRLPPESLRSARQDVLAADAGGVTLRIRRPDPPASGGRRGAVAESLARYIKPTAFIQSDAPEIVSTARRITAGKEDILEAARALHVWIYKKVLKKSASGLPSALDVLHTMEGDCNEHSYLFVALARAAGIAARVNIGVVYLDGAFYYHVWPSVYAGRWVDFDPTLGQFPVDATHIMLMEGEGRQQLALLGVIGKVSVRVLRAEYDETARAGREKGGIHD